MSQRKFIQKAVKHPGELRRYAEKEGCVNPNGTLKDKCLNEHINHMTPSQKKQHLKRAYNFYHYVLKPAHERMESQ